MCLPNWVWIQIFHKYSRDVNINWYKDINKWNQQNLKKHFSTTSQFIVLWKHKAKKFTENDYDKWALNDFHIPHNMISTCSGYPFFFCGQDHWFQRHIWNIFAFFRSIKNNHQQVLEQACQNSSEQKLQFYFSTLAPNQQLVLQSQRVSPKQEQGPNQYQKNWICKAVSYAYT